jgi:hypothetical protein
VRQAKCLYHSRVWGTRILVSHSLHLRAFAAVRLDWEDVKFQRVHRDYSTRECTLVRAGDCPWICSIYPNFLTGDKRSGQRIFMDFYGLESRLTGTECLKPIGLDTNGEL